MAISRVFLFIASAVLSSSIGLVQASVVDQAMQAKTAEEAVEIATNEVLELITEGQSYVDANPDRFYEEVKTLLDPMIDFERFARSVMGVWYKKASPEQFERFSESFKWSLVKTYATALTEFHAGEVRVVPNKRRNGPTKSLVTMEIDWQGKTYTVVYDMRKKSEVWQLVNVSIEGINLGLNYKSQFDSAMKGPKFGRDLEKVIEAWANQVREAERQSAAADAR